MGLKCLVKLIYIIECIIDDQNGTQQHILPTQNAGEISQNMVNQIHVVNADGTHFLLPRNFFKNVDLSSAISAAFAVQEKTYMSSNTSAMNNSNLDLISSIVTTIDDGIVNA